MNWKVLLGALCLMLTIGFGSAGYDYAYQYIEMDTTGQYIDIEPYSYNPIWSIQPGDNHYDWDDQENLWIASNSHWNLYVSDVTTGTGHALGYYGDSMDSPFYVGKYGEGWSVVPESNTWFYWGVGSDSFFDIVWDQYYDPAYDPDPYYFIDLEWYGVTY